MSVTIIIYELLHFIAIIISRPDNTFNLLPLSWYASVPLSFLPVILAYMTFTCKDNNGNVMFIYIISKILMLPGFIAYMINASSHYPLQYILALALFLLIDVILIINFTIIIKKNQKNNQKPDETP